MSETFVRSTFFNGMNVPQYLKRRIRAAFLDMDGCMGDTETPAMIATGLMEMLQTEPVLSMPKYVVSSCALERIRRTLNALHPDLLGLMAGLVSASKGSGVKQGKPAPDCYLHACKQAGLSPGYGFAVEDSAVGAEAALKAGLLTFGVVEFAKPNERERVTNDMLALGTHAVVDSWATLGKLLPHFIVS